MYCDYCGKEVKDEAVYCRDCGKKINRSAVDKIDEGLNNLGVEINGMIIPLGELTSQDGKDKYFFERAGEAYDKGDFQEAIEYYSEVINIDPKNHRAFYNRGYSWSNLGQFENALKDINNAVKINPNYAMGFCGKGEVLMALRKPEEAIICFNKAIELNPSFQKTYLLRAKYYLLKNYKNGIMDMEKANKLGSLTGFDYLVWGELYRMSGQNDLAKEKYKFAINLGEKRAIAPLELLNNT